MSNLQQIKASLDKYIEQLSEPNLEKVRQFISQLIEQERDEATAELLEIPDLLEDIALAKQDIDKGDLTDWREIRNDV